jgi:hypothetical protein
MGSRAAAARPPTAICRLLASRQAWPSERQTPGTKNSDLQHRGGKW